MWGWYLCGDVIYDKGIEFCGMWYDVYLFELNEVCGK